MLKGTGPGSPLSGRLTAAAADKTPGTFRSFSVACWKKVARLEGLSYLEAGRETSAVNNPAGSKPGSELNTSRKLLIISPAPVSSTKAKAISETTKTRRIRPRAAPAVPVRPPSFKVA